jgi:hypothetical protein
MIAMETSECSMMAPPPIWREGYRPRGENGTREPCDLLSTPGPGGDHPERSGARLICLQKHSLASTRARLDQGSRV